MRRPTARELDRSVAEMLRIGVSLSAVVVFVGGMLLLRHPWIPTPDYSHFQASSAARTSLTGILYAALQLQPQSIIQLGLVLLIATPVARVVLCVVGFARQRNALYVVVSSLVLAILIYSLTKGRS